MPLGELLHTLPIVARKTARSIEQTNRKLAKAKSAVLFNRQCLNEDILPIYTNIKPHDPAVRHAQFTKEYRIKLVENQIECKEKLIEELESQQLYLLRSFTSPIFPIKPKKTS